MRGAVALRGGDPRAEAAGVDVLDGALAGTRDDEGGERLGVVVTYAIDGEGVWFGAGAFGAAIGVVAEIYVDVVVAIAPLHPPHGEACADRLAQRCKTWRRCPPRRGGEGVVTPSASRRSRVSLQRWLLCRPRPPRWRR